MPLPPPIEGILTRLADALFKHRAFPAPDCRRLQTCKIIAHRGSHDNRLVLENTMTAFQQAAEAGVWGIEMDIRWTRDRLPVVFHDPDLNRLYGRPEAIAAFTLNELQRQYPAIPTLEEVVSRFGKKIHLMIEVKQQSRPGIRFQEKCLEEILQSLEPVQDYHLLTLDPALLQPFTRIPSRARVAVAEGWPGFSSRWVRRHDWGGLCGHYLLVGAAMMRHHHKDRRRVGTGFIASRSCLFRELNRGVDWIFSNSAETLQKEIQQEITLMLQKPEGFRDKAPRVPP
jgi:glycerophosphoryl diester phosphodiesterase